VATPELATPDRPLALADVDALAVFNTSIFHQMIFKAISLT